MRRFGVIFFYPKNWILIESRNFHFVFNFIVFLSSKNFKCGFLLAKYFFSQMFELMCLNFSYGSIIVALFYCVRRRALMPRSSCHLFDRISMQGRMDDGQEIHERFLIQLNCLPSFMPFRVVSISKIIFLTHRASSFFFSSLILVEFLCGLYSNKNCTSIQEITSQKNSFNFE